MKGSMLCVKIALKPDAIVISGIDATLHRKEPLAPDSAGDVRWSPISASIFPQLLEKEQALLCHDRVSYLYKYSGLASAVHSPHTSVISPRSGRVSLSGHRPTYSLYRIIVSLLSVGSGQAPDGRLIFSLDLLFPYM